ncbi:hypothetical protein Tco_1352473 [Tanacetum coccineum]
MSACLDKVNAVCLQRLCIQVVYRDNLVHACLSGLSLGKSDEQQEEQGEERKLKQVDDMVLSDDEVDEVNIVPNGIYEDYQGSRPKKQRKKSKKLDIHVIVNDEAEDNEKSEKYKDKSLQKKKRKGKKAELVENEMVEAEMVEIDKVESESNEEPPLRKKKLDAPSFVDVRKLKGDMLVKRNRNKRQVSVKKGKQKINEGSLVSFKEGKKDKDEGVLMVVKKGKEVVLNEKVKRDLVNILTRMSPSHLKNDMKDCLNDKFSKIKALLLDTGDKIKISLDKNPEDSDLKIILGKRLALFKELNHRNDDNAMVFLDNSNDVPEESVKENEVSKEKDDVTEKEKDVEKMFDIGGKNTVQKINREKDVENLVDQDVDKPEDDEKEKVEKNTEDLIKGIVVSVEISKKEVSKGVLAINEDPLKDSQSETSIFDSRLEDSQLEEQESQPGMEIGAEIQEENLEQVKNYETLEEVDFLSIGLEDIESLKGGGRILFDDKSTVQNVNEDDMILQDSLLNIPFLSTQEVACLEIDTQKPPQIQKQGIPKSFHSNKLKLGKYVLPDAQATGEKRQEVMVTETSIFPGKETKKFDSIKSKLVKNNDGVAECMKEKPINELKGKSINFEGGHPTVKTQQIKKEMEGEKNVPKTCAKKTNADKQDIKKPQKKEPNDKEETAIHASPISFINPLIDTESVKRQGNPSNFLVSPFYQRKVILDKPVSEEGKKIVEYIWSKNTPEG